MIGRNSCFPVKRADHIMNNSSLNDGPLLCVSCLLTSVGSRDINS